MPEGRIASSPDKKGVLLSTEAEAATHVDRLREADYRVAKVESKERKEGPRPPFKTSTLQQEAARKLGFGARKTMTLAQRLYEGVDLPGEGTVGLITYMRTDSLTIADAALREIAELVRTSSATSTPWSEPRRFKTRSRNAQEAHEAIRPTSALRTPDRSGGGARPRPAASVHADLAADRGDADGTGSVQPGGRGHRCDQRDRRYWPPRDRAHHDLRRAPARVLGGAGRRARRGGGELPWNSRPISCWRSSRSCLSSTSRSRRRASPRRPSSRRWRSSASEGPRRTPRSSRRSRPGYVRLEDRRFFPNDVGEVVTDKLVEHFPDIVNVNFTAEMEEDLDEIAEGDLQRVQVLRQFYVPFADSLDRAEEKFERFVEELGEDCPRCIEEGRDLAGAPAEALAVGWFFYRVYAVRRGGRRVQVHPQPRRTGAS